MIIRFIYSPMMLFLQIRQILSYTHQLFWNSKMEILKVNVEENLEIQNDSCTLQMYVLHKCFFWRVVHVLCKTKNFFDKIVSITLATTFHKTFCLYIHLRWRRNRWWNDIKHTLLSTKIRNTLDYTWGVRLYTMTFNLQTDSCSLSVLNIPLVSIISSLDPSRWFNFSFDMTDFTEICIKSIGFMCVTSDMSVSFDVNDIDKTVLFLFSPKKRNKPHL